MAFEKAHRQFIDNHILRRKGVRRARLEKGHGHGETLFLKNVWWPLYRNLDHLHPEYEVPDWRGRSYFGDFAFLPGHLRFILEIKGYGPHVTEMDRTKYSNELNRELFLQTLGYRVISLAYDDVAHRPEICRNLLTLLFNRHLTQQQPLEPGALKEAAVIRLCLSSMQPIRPKQVAAHLCIDHRTAIRILHSLTQKGWLRPIYSGAGLRVHQYELIRNAWDLIN
ncbi:hypothetical protein [Paenibacillus bouchesdurhonensis]|uniref:hypothetical protein n=1 Tax=Paenibacillus bouchesdurhonensis TaxID=1870990 RepID=UPI000DA60692|nr:hypothetical protein [Paenibacillus bouchesdurhonensis]